MAAYAVVCYLFPVVFSISNAVAQSAQPIISFNYGARQIDRIRMALKLLLQTAVVAGLFICFALIVGAPKIVSLFLDSQEAAYGLAVEGLPLFAACAAFFSVNIAFIGYYQSIDRSLAPTVFTLLRGVLLLVPCFLLLPRIIGVPGLWLAIPAAEILTCVVIVCFYFGHRFRLDRAFMKSKL